MTAEDTRSARGSAVPPGPPEPAQQPAGEAFERRLALRVRSLVAGEQGDRDAAAARGGQLGGLVVPSPFRCPSRP